MIFRGVPVKRNTLYDIILFDKYDIILFGKYEITLLKIWLPEWEWLWPEVAKVAQGVDEGHVGAAHQ